MSKEEIIEDIMGEIGLAYMENPTPTEMGEVEKVIAERLYNLGYRRAEEVRKKTAKDIADWLEFRYWHGEPNTQNLVLAKLIRTNYGVEVNE